MNHIADDLVIGAQALSDETGIPRRTIYRLSELGQLPVFKLGGQLAARRSELREALSARASVSGLRVAPI